MTRPAALLATAMRESVMSADRHTVAVAVQHWSPLSQVQASLVTEIGGVLSHAAIVAREVGIPAVLSVPRATELLTPSSADTVNGTTGHISV